MAIFTVLIGIFVLLMVCMIPFAIIKLAMAKPVACPQCGAQLKLITQTGKCTNCKAKLFKHVEGDYRVRA